MKILNIKGAVLTYVIVILLLVMAMVGYMVSFSYNQRLMKNVGGGRRAKIVYYAQAGVIDAMYRIRENDTTGLTPAPPIGGLNDPAYNPDPYSMDVDLDGQDDVRVDIGVSAPIAINNYPMTLPLPTANPANLNYTARRIDSTGLDA